MILRRKSLGLGVQSPDSSHLGGVVGQHSPLGLSSFVCKIEGNSPVRFCKDVREAGRKTEGRSSPQDNCPREPKAPLFSSIFCHGFCLKRSSATKIESC